MISRQKEIARGQKDDSPLEIVLAVSGIGVIVLVVVLGTLFYLLSFPGTPEPRARHKVAGSPPRPEQRAARESDSVVRSHKASKLTTKPKKRRGKTDSHGGGTSSSGDGSDRSSTGDKPTVPNASTRSPGPKIIKKFHGEGHESLPSFSVSGPWILKWESAGLFFAGYVYEEETDKLVKTLKSRTTSESDQPLEGGRYHLKINASNEWRVLVVAQ